MIYSTLDFPKGSISSGLMAWKGSHLSGIYMIYGLRMHVYDDWLLRYEKIYGRHRECHDNDTTFFKDPEEGVLL